MGLEPQTTIYKLLFQLDDSKSLYRKWLEITKHPFFKWLFGVPGVYMSSTKIPVIIDGYSYGMLLSYISQTITRIAS